MPTNDVEQFLRGIFQRLQEDEAQIDGEWGPEDGFLDALAHDAPILGAIASVVADATQMNHGIDPYYFGQLVASLRNPRLKEMEEPNDAD